MTVQRIALRNCLVHRVGRRGRRAGQAPRPPAARPPPAETILRLRRKPVDVPAHSGSRDGAHATGADRGGGGCHHRSKVESQLRARSTGKLLWQPANRDTAAGVFLPLAYVRARDPHAAVEIHPSVHLIYPEHQFLETVRQAMVSAEASRNACFCWASSPIGWRPSREGFSAARS